MFSFRAVSYRNKCLTLEQFPRDFWIFVTGATLTSDWSSGAHSWPPIVACADLRIWRVAFINHVIPLSLSADIYTPSVPAPWEFLSFLEKQDGGSFSLARDIIKVLLLKI